MYGTAENTLADRFAWLIDGLCKAVGVEAHKRRVEAALAWATWNRVRLLGAQFIALAVRIEAGQLPGSAARAAGRVVYKRSGRRSTEPRPAAAPRAPRSPQAQFNAAAGLPQDFGWIRRLLPETAQYAGLLSYLLDDPEVVVLVEKAPQAKRILRPLCHLLGVKTPEFLRRRARRDATPAQAPEAQPAAEVPPTAEVPAEPPPLPVQAAVPVPLPPQPARPPPGGLAWDGRRWIWL
jgi:hypothetical protein